MKFNADHVFIKKNKYTLNKVKLNLQVFTKVSVLYRIYINIYLHLSLFPMIYTLESTQVISVEE